jgi:O-antigen/teichoic acid export membrane protein
MHQFSSAVLDQMVLSGTNFVVSLLLIRYSTDQDYGLYVLVQSAVLLLTTCQTAWLTGPLATLTPRLSPEQRVHTITSVKRVQRRTLMLGAIVLLTLPALGYVTGLLSGLLAAVIAVGIVASWAALRREYLRGLLLMYSRPHTLLFADAAYAGVLGAVVTTAVVLGRYIVVVAACAVAIAGMIGAGVANRSLARDPGWREGESPSIWLELRRMGNWALLGSTIYWFLGQSYSYTLATRLDLKAVADVNAVRALVNPTIILTIGVVSLLTPTAARWYAQIGLQKLLRQLILLMLAVGLVEIAYFVAVWVCRDWLVQNLFHKHIQNRDELLMLWGGVAIMSLLRDVLQCALTAMGKFKSLAWQVGVGAAVALLLMWYGTSWWGAAAVLIGQIAGEVINLAGIVISIRKHVLRGAT